MKKVFAAAIAAMMLTFGCVALAGCSQPSAEEVIRQGLTRELDQVKNLDGELMGEIGAMDAAGELEAYGITAQSFMETYFDGFDYSIDSVTIDEADKNKATAVVTLKVKSLTDVYTEITEASTEFATNSDVSSMTEDEINKKVGEIVLNAISAVPAEETDAVSLPLICENNEWQVTDAGLQALGIAMFNL